MLRRLSESPASPQPCPGCVPHRCPLWPPARLPAFLNNVPAGCPSGSAPHSSTAVLHTPPQSLPASSPPAPQTTHAHTSADTPPPSPSTPPITARSEER